MIPKNITLDTTLTDKQNLVGQIFGRLTCLQVAGTVQDGNAKQLCYSFLCACGNKVIKRGKDVVSGKTQSCGCLHQETSKITGLANKKEEKTNEPAKHRYYMQYVSAANRRGLSFELTEDEFFNLTSSKCHYCGKDPTKIYGNNWKGYSLPYICNGVDRSENSLGYTLNNSVSCCSMCNYMKSDYNKEEFLSHVKEIAAHNSN